MVLSGSRAAVSLAKGATFVLPSPVPVPFLFPQHLLLPTIYLNLSEDRSPRLLLPLDIPPPSWHNRDKHSFKETYNEWFTLSNKIAPGSPFLSNPSVSLFRAVRSYCSHDATTVSDPIPYRSFSDVFRAVATGEVTYGMVPVENSQAGSINDVYDLLRQHDLFIVGEIGHPVNHCLLCLPGQQISDITRVISHPQALAQSDVFLRDLGVEVVATYDTAGSAKMIHDDLLTGVAAVAAARAAELYELEILASSIQTIKNNFTRFIVLSRESAAHQPGPSKTMIVMATTHQPGSLYQCLGALATNQINMLKLESRPSRQRPWEYVFYLDFEGHREDATVRNALADLAIHTTFCKVLGSFSRSI